MLVEADGETLRSVVESRHSIEATPSLTTGESQSSTSSILDGSVSERKRTLLEVIREADSPGTPVKISTWPKLAKDDPTKEFDIEEVKRRVASEQIAILEASTEIPSSYMACDLLADPVVGEVTDPKTFICPIPNDQSQYQHWLRPDIRTQYSSEAKSMARRLTAMRLHKKSTAVSKDSALFSKIWNQELLPALMEIADEHHVPGVYTITPRRGLEAGHKIIDVMTEKPIDVKVAALMVAAKDKCLPENLRSTSSFEFCCGTVEYASSTELSDTESVCVPLNTRRYTNPVMGDSVGPEWGGTTTTLGPMLKIAKSVFWLLNWHTFDDDEGVQKQRTEIAELPGLKALHPSPDDFKGQSTGQPVIIGPTVAYSGKMYETSRASRSFSPDMTRNYKTPLKVATDWVLCETTMAEACNKVRLGGEFNVANSFSEIITRIEDPVNESRFVYTTGRSSGYTMGQICTGLSGMRHPNGTTTFNWAIESTGNVSEICFERHGAGLPGDSGAGVVDWITNGLLGQLWGRNKYEKNHHKDCLTFFTAMTDILDDIQERFPGYDRPTLPGAPSTGLDTSSDRRNNLAIIDEHNALAHVGLTANTHIDFVGIGGTFVSNRRSSSRKTTSLCINNKLVTENWTNVKHGQTWPIIF